MDTPTMKIIDMHTLDHTNFHYWTNAIGELNLPDDTQSEPCAMKNVPVYVQNVIDITEFDRHPVREYVVTLNGITGILFFLTLRRIDRIDRDADVEETQGEEEPHEENEATH